MVLLEQLKTTTNTFVSPTASLNTAIPFTPSTAGTSTAAKTTCSEIVNQAKTSSLQTFLENYAIKDKATPSSDDISIKDKLTTFKTSIASADILQNIRDKRGYNEVNTFLQNLEITHLPVIRLVDNCLKENLQADMAEYNKAKATEEESKTRLDSILTPEQDISYYDGWFPLIRPMTESGLFFLFGLGLLMFITAIMFFLSMTGVSVQIQVPEIVFNIAGYYFNLPPGTMYYVYSGLFIGLVGTYIAFRFKYIQNYQKMALDPSTKDPCSLLNVASYPNIWVTPNESDSTAYAKVAAAGVTKTYLSALTATGLSLTGNLLASPSTTSTYRLVQFLSGGGVAAADSSKRYDQMADLALKAASTYESIVDTYIVGTKGLNKGSSYKYASPDVPIVTEANLWVTGDDTVSTPVSLLGKLIQAGYLLSATTLFTQSQLAPDATNLRFFGAFLCEYCFYRTRYEWLLSKYFTIHSMTASTYSAASNSYGLNTLFAGTGTGDNQYSSSQPSQNEYLKGLAYHMACLNTRMTDMRRLLGAINMYYNGVFTSIQTSLNDASLVGSNSELTKTIKALQSSANDANGYLSQSEFTKSVMEYNSEKNRYSNVLLGLYAFLNIAVLATVFQLARTPQL